ncbi:hypothetical protein N7494_008094 [Penicillium frequentans]|uniref:Hydrophobin n=1 Tax=Penicillium frequentans TaxID=3151616 RepID=A0AAD6GE33_9EURO|nr:hypothetical protein N7494_008094 [Penicillium glabrum]
MQRSAEPKAQDIAMQASLPKQSGLHHDLLAFHLGLHLTPLSPLVPRSKTRNEDKVPAEPEEPAKPGDAVDGPCCPGLQYPVNEVDPCCSGLGLSKESPIVPCCEGFVPESAGILNVALTLLQSMPEAAASLL